MKILVAGAGGFIGSACMHARRRGFQKARNNLILTLDIDIVLSRRVRDYLGLVGKGNIRLVSFSKFSPTAWRKIVARLIQKLWYHQSFRGLYAIDRKAWQETERWIE